MKSTEWIMLVFVLALVITAPIIIYLSKREEDEE